MKKLNLIGKSREQIESMLGPSYRRADLLDLIFQLASIEPHFSPSTIAAAREMTTAKVLKLIKEGAIPGVHKPLDNGYRVSLSGIRAWDKKTAVKLGAT